jgi:predicted ATP-dependent endonuclease of OLD family
MKLKIDNFAKIEHADILVDGITVIAGENNTGKSTVGKVLFSLFNSINDIETKIGNQRIKEIGNTCHLLIRNYLVHKKPMTGIVIDTLIASSNVANNIADEIQKLYLGKNAISKDEISNILKKVLLELAISKDDEIDGFSGMIDEIADKVLAIGNLSDKAIKLEVLTRYFNSVFYKQMNSLSYKSHNAKLELEIKGNPLKLTFSNNECTDFSANIPILHKAVYIDNPFIIDKLSDVALFNTMDEFLIELLKNYTKDNIMDGIIGSVLAKEKLNEAYKALQSVVDGQIVEKQKNEFYLQNEDFSQPIYFNNLSAGLKAFVIIKMLLEKGALKEKDVLILDEPEIHLHPQWQVAYAELIVLLQKSFDLSIIIATHSPYFLDAINLFSVKHGIYKKVNYYLSSMENNKVSMELVSDNIDLIYKKMASPVQVLDSLRYELNNQ